MSGERLLESLCPFDLESLSGLRLGPRAQGRRRAVAAARSVAVERAASARGPAQRARMDAISGWLEHCLGRTARGLRLIESACARDDRLEYALWRAALLKSLGRSHEAAAAFSAILKRRPSCAPAYFGRAETFKNLGRHEEALADAERLVELVPNDGLAYRLRARLRVQLGRLAEALEDLDRSAALDPCSEAFAWRGEARRRAGRLAEALEDLDRAVGFRPVYPQAYAWRGALKHAMGFGAAALPDLRRAAAALPESAFVHAWLGLSLRERGRLAASAAELDRALALQADFAWALHQRFQTRLAQQRWAQALADLDAAHDLDRRFGWLEAGDELDSAFPERLSHALRRAQQAARALPGSLSARVWRRRLGERTRRLPEPVPESSYDVMLGYRCDVTCLFCSQELGWRRQPWLPLEAACERVFAAAARGCRRLNVLGGEPTLYPRIEALVAFARRAGFREIQFESNGLALADAAFCRRLVEAGLTRVSVSVHSHLPRVHDRLVCREGAFERVLRALENLRDAGCARRIAVVINGGNVADLSAFARFFWDLGVRELQFIFPLHTGDFLNHVDSMQVSLSRASSAVRRAIETLERRGCSRLPIVHNVPPCFLGGLASQSGDWGDVGMRVLKPDGVERSDSPDRPLYRKVHVAACERCSVRTRCVGLDPGYLARWGEGEVSPLARG